MDQLAAVKTNLTLNRGPAGFLLLSLVRVAVDDINDYVNRRKASRQITITTYNETLRRAKVADQWLMGEIQSRLSLDDVAQYHDMDLDKLRSTIYQQWEPRIIERIRRLHISDGLRSTFISVTDHESPEQHTS